jgi:hypothetical protein
MVRVKRLIAGSNHHDRTSPFDSATGKGDGMDSGFVRPVHVLDHRNCGQPRLLQFVEKSLPNPTLVPAPQGVGQVATDGPGDIADRPECPGSRQIITAAPQDTDIRAIA